MERRFEWDVDSESVGMRVDKYISGCSLGLTRSAAENLAAKGLILKNGKPAGKSERLQAGDRMQLTLPEPEALTVAPEAIPLDILYEDDDLLVVNKPKGMVVHPAAGNYSGTLVNALLAQLARFHVGHHALAAPTESRVRREQMQRGGQERKALPERMHLFGARLAVGLFPSAAGRGSGHAARMGRVAPVFPSRYARKQDSHEAQPTMPSPLLEGGKSYFDLALYIFFPYGISA